MGGDGGQVIDRATMVKCKGWGLTKESGGRHAASLGEMNSYLQMVTEDRGLSSLQRHEMRMTSCWLSQEPLREPVVACRLGNLYNKESLINALLNKKIPKEISHIRALKDVKPCLITWKEAEKEEGRRRMVCPVSRDDLDAGSSRAVLIWASGAVLSPKSLKELKLTECPVTGKAFDVDKDLIPLAPEGEELDRLRERLPVSKKRKAAAAPEDEGSSKVAASSSSAPAAASSDSSAAKGKAGASGAGDKSAERSKAKDTDVYKRLFKPGGEGMTGTRDGFGTPAFNRGSIV
mmetsp:Transcript_47710/g.120931  ORF Transcript_47710/g.120931 Transcript_47710/m.120931 type:complete len:291 (+) Transcript_47710:103-975(+)